MLSPERNARRAPPKPHPREAEVVPLLEAGVPEKEIEARLGIGGRRIRQMRYIFEREQAARANSHVREQLKVANRRLLEFERNLGKKGVFSKTEFRQLLMLCHPDNSTSDEMKAHLLNLLKANESRLIKPDK